MTKTTTYYSADKNFMIEILGDSDSGWVWAYDADEDGYTGQGVYSLEEARLQWQIIID